MAIGLEAYDDEVLKFHCNKGFRIKTWKKAVDTLQSHGLRAKSYLLFKPPFMSEGDALQHMTKWIQEIAADSDEISVNPMNIQRRTIVDRIFRHREYRPPWLWSLVQMIRNVHPDVEDKVRLIVHPTAAGSIRGAHNCGRCDKEVAAAIERYSVSGSLLEFEGLSCDCESQWATEIALDQSLPIPLGTGLDRRLDSVEALLSP